MSRIRKALVLIGLVATSTPWAVVATLAVAPPAMIRMLFTNPEQAARLTSSFVEVALFSSLALLPLSASAIAGAHIRNRLVSTGLGIVLGLALAVANVLALLAVTRRLMVPGSARPRPSATSTVTLRTPVSSHALRARQLQSLHRPSPPSLSSYFQWRA